MFVISHNGTSEDELQYEVKKENADFRPWQTVFRQVPEGEGNYDAKSGRQFVIIRAWPSIFPAYVW